MTEYKVIRCNDCKTAQTTAATKYYLCSKCNKSKKILERNVLFKTFSGRSAREFLIKYNKELRRLKNGK